MKIQTIQLTADERRKIAHAIDVYCSAVLLRDMLLYEVLEYLRLEIEHSEVLLCKYNYDREEVEAW